MHTKPYTVNKDYLKLNLRNRSPKLRIASDRRASPVHQNQPKTQISTAIEQLKSNPTKPKTKRREI